MESKLLTGKLLKCYKIVSVYSDKSGAKELRSFVQCMENDPVGIIYTPGEWVVGRIPGSWLFVFDTLENLEYMYGIDGPDSEVWECECDELVPMEIVPECDEDCVIRYWEWVKENGLTVPIVSGFGDVARSVKPGTCVVRRLKMVKRIY